MPRRSELALSQYAVDALSAAHRDTIFWDRDLPGFGVRVYPSGRKVYVVQCRGPHGLVRVSLGRHGALDCHGARKRAAAMLDRIKRGEAPAGRAPRPSLTVADLAQRYLEAHVAVNCNAHTLGIYRGALRNHILPALGTLPVGEVGRAHVAALQHRLRRTPTAANETVAALPRVLNRAEGWGLMPAGGNPCRFVARYRTRRLERFLTEEEFRRLGRVLDELQAEGGVPVHAAAAIRLLMLTGCRSGEITTLRWEDVDLEANELRLADSKTGPRTVALSPAAVRVLAGLARLPGNPWVVAGRKPGARLAHITYYWYRVRARAGLGDVRLHDLRHSFASRALALGEPLPMIGKLLGHSKIRTTARYAHLARDSVRESAARVAASIGADLLVGGARRTARWRTVPEGPARNPGLYLYTRSRRPARGRVVAHRLHGCTSNAAARSPPSSRPAAYRLACSVAPRPASARRACICIRCCPYRGQGDVGSPWPQADGRVE